jgi:subtilisin family serine protease
MVAAVGNHSNWDLLNPTATGDGGSGDGGSGDGGSGDGGSATDDSDPALYSVTYPARYPEVIAVGAIDEYGDLGAYSNFGPEMNLLAPGSHIVSTDVGGGFGVCSGTSMAVPFVTGTVAMMLALDPSLTPSEVRDILINTAIEGELNLAGALEAVANQRFQGSYTPGYIWEALDSEVESQSTTPTEETDDKSKGGGKKK